MLHDECDEYLLPVPASMTHRTCVFHVSYSFPLHLFIQGLKGAVADLPPQEMRVSEDGESGPVLKVWVDECEVGFPQRLGDSESPLTPR